MLGLNGYTPGYRVRDAREIRVKAWRKVGYEEKLGKRTEWLLLKKHWKEKVRDDERGMWKDERVGNACLDAERLRKNGWEGVQVPERRERISEARYNEAYKQILAEKCPYTWRESRKKREIISSFSCGNEERETRYWMKEELRK